MELENFFQNIRESHSAQDLSEIQEMREWAKNDRIVQVQTEEHHELYKNKQKLGLFPDGKLSSDWCKN